MRPIVALRATAVLALLGLSTGCDFKPLYGKSETPTSRAAADNLQAIKIGTISGDSSYRTEYLLRNSLLDRLNPRGEPGRPSYRLEIVLSEFKEALAITTVDEATRTNLVIAARYRLFDTATNAPVHASEVRGITAYNLLRADFGNVAAEADARQRVARELAENIRLELATWFTRPAAQRP
jgi:LPS-assembly lipoprotein